MKRLYRSKKDRRVSGILGGLGAYLNVDSTLLRVFYVFVTFVLGIVPAVLAYIFAAIIIPEENDPDVYKA